MVKRFRWLGLSFFFLFLALLSVRMGIPGRLFSAEKNGAPTAPLELPDADTWMDLYLKGRKIGYTHSVLTKAAAGYRLQETLLMRMNVMGMSQSIRMVTLANLKPDLCLSSFELSMSSGLIAFEAKGEVQPDSLLTIETDLGGVPQKSALYIEHPLRLAGTLVKAAVRDLSDAPGRHRSFYMFDPATLSQMPVDVRVMGREDILSMGRRLPATKLELNFKGATQTVWIDASGDTIKEEGVLGLTLERTTREIALGGSPLEAAEDITEIASVPVSVEIDTPRKATFLKIALSGIDPGALDAAGGRQALNGNILTIRTEALPLATAQRPTRAANQSRRFLDPEPFVESDHAEIAALAANISSGAETETAAAQRLVRWVFENIRKRPLISVPDALSTLRRRAGDCNEHAVLLAALARSAGIPARIESGLVFVRGRFYYHAWNSLYLGRWVTADAVFGQLPADATHIRFAAGGPQSQLDLMPLIDRIRITVLESAGEAGGSGRRKASR